MLLDVVEKLKLLGMVDIGVDLEKRKEEPKLRDVSPERF